ncbi:hypothetical protein PGQ11_010161 [Apiospora arundinis]|uniref:Uncharacterized protein n=1 Tax=Apiospora arundinis TaxID=335852 RepID=A0ABR2I8V9_9PEZI
MGTDAQVYLGVWTNWSRGSVMGSTLTMTKASGNILIAFTAIFIPFVASRLWKMLCFTIHTCTSKRNTQDAIYHQRQAVLRNSSSPDASVISLFSLLWSWHDPKVFARLLPLIILAFLFITGFTAAGGYSSQITSVAGDEVLIKGDNCGLWNNTAASTSYLDYVTSTSSDANDWADAMNYAQQCYTGQGINALDCSRFIVRGLPNNSPDGNAGCPFPSAICRDNATNLRLDSGYIDSNDHLGLNTPPDQRFSFRQVLSCAPLRTEGYTTTHKINNMSFVRYNYGRNAFSTNSTFENFTWSVPDLNFQYSQRGSRQVAGFNFRLVPHIRKRILGGRGRDFGTFSPGNAINITYGDVILTFLSGNGVYFAQESDDAWYRATNPVDGERLRLLKDPNTVSGIAYQTSEAASPLGCVQQYQFCNPKYATPEGCGPLTGWYDSIAGAYPLFNLTTEDSEDDLMSETRRFTKRGTMIEWAYSVGITGGDYGIYDAVRTLGPKSLASQSFQTTGVQFALAKDQWKLDVINWWNMTQARHQAVFLETAIGYSKADADLQHRYLRPIDDKERQLCNSQKTRNAGYASFSMFGLLFTYILGSLLILLSFALDPVMRCLHRRRHYRQYQYLEWRTNGALQLQRLAQDELGYGQWTRCAETVPVTRRGDLLAGLDVRDVEYPRLNRDVIVKTEESKTEESKTEESKTEESKTEESKTEESKTEESKTEESKTEESKTEESKTGESKTGESEAAAAAANEPVSADSPRKKKKIEPSVSWASRATLLWQKTFVHRYSRFGSWKRRDPGISVVETDEAPVSPSTVAHSESDQEAPASPHRPGAASGREANGQE